MVTFMEAAKNGRSNLCCRVQLEPEPSPNASILIICNDYLDSIFNDFLIIIVYLILM